MCRGVPFINVKKTKVMHVKNKPEDINVNILGSEPLENVTDFTYLGSTLSYNGRLSTELDSRIGKTSTAYNKLRPVLNNKKISANTRLRIFHVVVVSILLYSSETWNITIRYENRLAAFFNRCLRQILCMTWEDKVSTEELQKRACSPNLKTLLRRKRLSWFGPVVRMAPVRMQRRTYFWQPKGKRSRGRQMQRWNATLLRDLN